MRSPANQQIIQVEVTNMCPHRCSNCTRFCGHHRKPFIMEFDVFKQAILSLVDYPGMVGFMGGEPTMIPEFEKYVKFYSEHIPKHRRGLWTSLGKYYYEHFELIKDTFSYECINDHVNPGLHQPLLVASDELPIPEERKAELIDKCWVQMEWSASITPKGAFFCEVAGAMDMLFDGTGGWPIEKDWWWRVPEQFGSQRDWCKRCGAAMPLPRRRGNEEVDDISPGNHELLKEISPKVKNGAVSVFDVSNYTEERDWNPDHEWYMPDNNMRISDTNTSIRPQSICGIVVCVGYDDFLRYTLPWNKDYFDKLIVVTSTKDENTEKVCEELGVEYLSTDAFYEKGNAFNKARAVNTGLAHLHPDDWVLFFDADIILPLNLRKLLDKRILNPGCMYYGGRARLPRDNQVYQLELLRQFPEYRHSLRIADWGADERPWGYFQLVNVRASAIKAIPQTDEHRAKYNGFGWMNEDCTTAGDYDSRFQSRWSERKKRMLKKDEFIMIHLDHGHCQGNWKGRRSPRLEPTEEELAAVKDNVAKLNQLVPYKEDGWTLLWRGDNASMWGAGIPHIDKNRKFYSQLVPAHVNYIKLRRLSTNDTIIVRLDCDPRKNVSLDDGYFWHGNVGSSYDALHFGLVSTCEEYNVVKGNKCGYVVIHTRAPGQAEFTGWGFGHRYKVDKGQGFCWGGKIVDPDIFEVACKDTLTPEEEQLVVNKEA